MKQHNYGKNKVRLMSRFAAVGEGRSLQLAALGLGLVLLAPSRAAFAGAPPGSVREAALAHVCKGGPTPGNACDPNASNCGTGSCVLDLTKGKSFTGTLTMIVDDTASGFADGDRTHVAITATLILEVKIKGTQDIIGKTFLNLDGATLTDVLTSLSDTGPKVADSPVGVNETALVNAVNSAAMMSQLLFQSGDSTMAQALRDLLQTTGTPIITKVGSIALFDHDPGGTSPNAATVIRAKVKGAVLVGP
jgi:hypothetical protein